MQTLRIYPSSINDRFIQQAVDTLRNGGVIIFPTDTFYAIGCNALSSPAIDRVCRIKGLNPQKTRCQSSVLAYHRLVSMPALTTRHLIS